MRHSGSAQHLNRKPRHATLIVELLLVLPIMLMFLFAMIEFSLVFASREQMSVACRAGACTAAQGGSEEEVHATIREILGRGRLKDARIEIVYFTEEIPHKDHRNDEDHEGHGSQSDRETIAEESEADHETSPFLVGRDRVAVFVRVPLTHVVPDALRWAGMSLRHHELTAATVMNVE